MWPTPHNTGNGECSWQCDWTCSWAVEEKKEYGDNTISVCGLCWTIAIASTSAHCLHHSHTIMCACTSTTTFVVVAVELMLYQVNRIKWIHLASDDRLHKNFDYRTMVEITCTQVQQGTHSCRADSPNVHLSSFSNLWYAARVQNKFPVCALVPHPYWCVLLQDSFLSMRMRVSWQS